MPHIFLSYRRSENPQGAGRIYDRLIKSFGTSNVFKDVDSIPLGVDFRQILDVSVSKCDAFIAVIGPNWASQMDEHGNRRLNDPLDFVRIEIESALKRNVPLIPLLIDGAQMPSPHELPESIRDLSFRNGTAVRADPDFHRDMDRVILAIGNATRNSDGTESADGTDIATADAGDHAKQQSGLEYRSGLVVLGLPLVHVAIGRPSQKGRRHDARGIIAIGDHPIGVLAIGAFPRGVVALGTFPMGVIPIGLFALGLFPVGAVAIGLVGAYGMIALAPVAVGALACGYYCAGNFLAGRFLCAGSAADPQADRFFRPWLKPWLHVVLITLCVLSYLVPQMIRAVKWAWGRKKWTL